HLPERPHLGHSARRPPVVDAVCPHRRARSRSDGALRHSGCPPGWGTSVLAGGREGGPAVGATRGGSPARGGGRLARGELDDPAGVPRGAAVRTVIGTTPRALARRGMALGRLAVVTRRRDAYAASPGETLPLWLGERTHYRAASAIRDVFDRPDGALGFGYTPWIPADVGGLVIQDRQVVSGIPAA